MTPEETAAYVEAHLAVGRVSGAVRALFDKVTVTRLHELSGGVPRRLHTAAQAVLRREPEAPPSEDATLGEPEAALDAPPLDEQESALDTPPEKAMIAPIASVASEIQEEIERLRHDAASRRAVAVRRPFFRRSATMVSAFAAAVVAGLLVTFTFHPLSSRVAPEPATPEPVVERAAPEPAPPEPVLERAAPEPAPPEPVLERAVPVPAGAVSETPTPDASPAAPVAATRERVPVNINATPWAVIDVDGEPLGETPLAGVPLATGPHTFRARMPDGRVVEHVVEIDAENRFVVFGEGPAAVPARP
jgi:hypothetical protein